MGNNVVQQSSKIKKESKQYYDNNILTFSQSKLF